MIDPKDLITTLEKIREIATSAAPKIAEVSAKDQVGRIADLADAAIERNQAKPPESDAAQGG